MSIGLVGRKCGMSRLFTEDGRSIPVGSGIGPRTWAPVRLAVFTISRVELSRIR